MSTQEMGRNLKKETEKPYLLKLNTEHCEKLNEATTSNSEVEKINVIQ